MGIENGGVYLHEVSGSLARELLGCISCTIIEAGSGSSLNKVVNIMDFLSLIFYFVPSPPYSIKLYEGAQRSIPRLPQIYHSLHLGAYLTLMPCRYYGGFLRRVPTAGEFENGAYFYG